MRARVIVGNSCFDFEHTPGRKRFKLAEMVYLRGQDGGMKKTMITGVRYDDAAQTVLLWGVEIP